MLGTISVVSMGFAAVLLGLAVDYAVVHYQEALAHPQMTVPEIRRAIAPSILWAAITTMSAFLVLNLGGLPGLGQLGTLVAIGVGIGGAGDGDDLSAAAVSRPPQALPNQPPVRWWNYFIPPPEAPARAAARLADLRRCRPPDRAALLLTVLILVAARRGVVFPPAGHWIGPGTPCVRNTAKRKRRWTKSRPKWACRPSRFG